MWYAGGVFHVNFLNRTDRAVGVITMVERKKRPVGTYVMGGAGATESRAEFERISMHRRSGRDPGCAYALHPIKLACVSMHASAMCLSAEQSSSSRVKKAGSIRPSCVARVLCSHCGSYDRPVQLHAWAHKKAKDADSPVPTYGP